MLVNLVKFALLAGLIFLAAWVASTGHVGYTVVMLIIAAALAYAVVDLLDYEMVKREKRFFDSERSRRNA